MKNILVYGLFLFISFSLQSQDIAQWRGINRDGVYHETGLLKSWLQGEPKLLWHFDGLGNGHSSAAVTKNFVYTSGTNADKGFVIALDHSGKTVWKTEYGKEWMESWEGVRSTPLVFEDKLYILSSFGKLVCMSSKTGNILWNVDVFTEYDGQNLKWGITENLLIDGNKLFCTPGGKQANIIAVNKDTGKLIWKSTGTGEKSAYCSPLHVNHNGKSIIVTHTESHIMGVDAQSGKLLWKHPQPNKYSVHANTPLYYKGN